MKRMMHLAALPLALLLVSTAHAADAKRGEELHNSQCISCHAARFGNNGNEIYTRANRRVTSLAGLHKQVTRCRDNLKVVWFDEDVDDVAAYLNKQFYKFKE